MDTCKILITLQVKDRTVSLEQALSLFPTTQWILFVWFS